MWLSWTNIIMEILCVIVGLWSALAFIALPSESSAVNRVKVASVILLVSALSTVTIVFFLYRHTHPLAVILALLSFLIACPAATYAWSSIYDKKGLMYRKENRVECELCGMADFWDVLTCPQCGHFYCMKHLNSYSGFMGCRHCENSIPVKFLLRELNKRPLVEFCAKHEESRSGYLSCESCIKDNVVNDYMEGKLRYARVEGEFSSHEQLVDEWGIDHSDDSEEDQEEK